MAFEQHCCVVMPKHISRNHYRILLVTTTQPRLELLFKVVLVWPKGSIEKHMSFERLFFLLSSPGLLKCQIFDQLRVVIGRLSEKEDLFVGHGIDVEFQEICDFIVGDVIFEVGLPLMVGDDFKFFDFLPSAT